MSNRIKLLLAILALLAIPFFKPGNVGADSGWDSDYDSGGSSWSSSSSSWDSSDSYGGSGEFTIFDAITIIVVFFFIVFVSIGATSPNHELKGLQEISEAELQQVFPDQTLQSIKAMAFNKFVAVQNCWMEFNYDGLKELCSNELYNSYVSDLEVLKLKNGKNIMDSFKLVNVVVVSARANDAGMGAVTVFLQASFHDYVINQGTGKVIRGNKHAKLVNSYSLTFIRDINGNAQDIHCPNCGSELKDNTTTVCEFCRSQIVKKPKDFVLSNKRKGR